LWEGTAYVAPQRLIRSTVNASFDSMARAVETASYEAETRSESISSRGST